MFQDHNKYALYLLKFPIKFDAGTLELGLPEGTGRNTFIRSEWSYMLFVPISTQEIQNTSWYVFVFRYVLGYQMTIFEKSFSFLNHLACSGIFNCAFQNMNVAIWCIIEFPCLSEEAYEQLFGGSTSFWSLRQYLCYPYLES